MEINKFSDLVGNTLAIALIKKGLKNKTLPQFVLLHGVCGTGKSSIAELIGMTLTCENPQNGEPCGVCSVCVANKAAFQKGGSGISPYIEKVNMAKVAKEKTMADEIKSTFQIIRSDCAHVKIFEEFHSLNESDQRLMLEETARVPEGVYVILTTTQIKYVLKEIVSRCLTFYFGRLNLGETSVLIDRINTNLRLKPDDYKMIYRKADGIPRNTVVLVDFLSRTNPSSEEMKDLFGTIDKNIFLNLFVNVGDFRLYMEDVVDLQNKYASEVILEQLIDFFVQVTFALEGEIYDVISKRELSQLPMKNIEILYKMTKLAENSLAGRQDIQLLFLRLRRLIVAPTSLYQQQISAEISQSIKREKAPKEGNVPVLKYFSGGEENESSNGRDSRHS